MLYVTNKNGERNKNKSSHVQMKKQTETKINLDKVHDLNCLCLLHRAYPRMRLTA